MWPEDGTPTVAWYHSRSYVIRAIVARCSVIFCEVSQFVIIISRFQGRRSDLHAASKDVPRAKYIRRTAAFSGGVDKILRYVCEQSSRDVTLTIDRAL